MSFCALVGWRGKGLPWIHLALSTLRPVTSPHVSAIRLKFTRSLFLAEDPAETLINYVGDDLRRIADEITRIEHEFGGVVNLTVLRDSVFGTVLDTLNVSPHFRGGRSIVIMLIHPHSFPLDPSGPRSYTADELGGPGLTRGSDVHGWSVNECESFWARCPCTSDHPPTILESHRWIS